MNGALQNRIRPHTAPSSVDFSEAQVKNPTTKALDANAENKVSFKDLLFNSNDEVVRKRAAEKNGDGLRGAKTDEEFSKMLAERFNRENLRKPQNELDKDAFLKLFVTQMQNQDPLNPDNSAEMASQLAQFHGLEQMMNVNKNLEKMQGEQATSRAVNLLGFVGKEIKLDNGRVRFEGGSLKGAQVKLAQDAPQVSMEVRDGSGVLMATRDLGYLTKGEHDLSWDGLTDKGEKSPEGTYTISVQARDLNGQDIPIGVTTLVAVQGVDLKEDGGSFYTELGKVRISEVSSVGDDGHQAVAPAKGRSAAQKLGAGGLLPGVVMPQGQQAQHGADGSPGELDPRMVAASLGVEPSPEALGIPPDPINVPLPPLPPGGVLSGDGSSAGGPGPASGDGPSGAPSGGVRVGGGFSGGGSPETGGRGAGSGPALTQREAASSQVPREPKPS